MDFQIVKKKSNPYVVNISIPISERMKRKLIELKEVYDVDVNQMTREFFQDLIEKAEDKLDLSVD
jgi:hypothetical protein